MDYPRIKPEHAPYRTVDGNVRVGGRVYGIGAEIKDPDKWVWRLVTLLDGTRTVEQVVMDVSGDYPDLEASLIRDSIGRLIQSGYVEDVGSLDPPVLTPHEKERYTRSRAFYRWVDLAPRGNSWEPQLRMRAAQVAILGLGGAGGTAASALAASGVGHLLCVDADVVELSNLSRQTLYSEHDLDTPKVDAAADRLRKINSDVDVKGERRWVESQEDIAELVRGYDVFALCADYPEGIRARANRACLSTGVPWVDGGYHGPMVTVGTYTPGEGACWECLRISENEDQASSLPIPEDAPRMDPRRTFGNPVSAASAGVSGHLVAHAVLGLITGAPALPTSCLYGINLAHPEDTVMTRHPRRADCPACGNVL